MFKDAQPTNVNYGGTMVMAAEDFTTSQGGTFATPADPFAKKHENAPSDDVTPYGCPTSPEVVENEARAAALAKKEKAAEESAAGYGKEEAVQPAAKPAQSKKAAKAK